jgi:hypothetical protein
MLEGTSDNGAPISVIMAFNYHTDGKRYHKKQFDLVGIEGYLSIGGKAVAEHLFDFEGKSGVIRNTIEKGAPNMTFHTATTLGGFGRARFGVVPTGSATQEQDNTTMGENMEKFRLIRPVDPADYYEGQTKITMDQLDSRLILVSFGANQRISPNNAVHAE